MNKTKKRSLAAMLFALVCVLVLALSLGMMSACGNDTDTAASESGAWYYGAAAPSDALGQEGDFYLNTKTLSSYKKAAGEWQKIDMAESGNWYYGVGAPDDGTGTVSDFYLDTEKGDLYQRTAEGWGDPILKLFGENGRDGVMWFSGEVPPAASDDLALKAAQKGDFYLDYGLFDVYQLGTDGETWNLLGNIRGEKGADAVDPVQFFNGNGTPDDNPELLANANEGDLYIGLFDGLDGNESGSRLYRKLGGVWIVLMESMTKNQVIVSTPEQVGKLFEKFSDGIPADETVKLGADIDLTGISSSTKGYIDSCDGEFDGGGHTITGLTKNPLFQDVKGGAYIHDLVIEIENGDSHLDEGSLARTLTVEHEGDVITVENVTITGTAKNVRTAFFDESGKTDGIPGVLNFINCVSDLDVTFSTILMSKLTGFISLPDNWEVNFTDCVNSGNLTGSNLMKNEVVGGFISYAQGNGSNHITFTRCRNEGNITLEGSPLSNPDVGGFVGKVQRATNLIFNDCANVGAVTVHDQGNEISVGGFIGQTTGGSVTFNGTNTNGAYTGQGQEMVADPEKGAITADNSSGTVNAGGFIGLASAPVTINLSGGSCVNAGSVTVTQTSSSSALNVNVGGLIGRTGAGMTFEDETLSHPYVNLGAVTAEVKSASSRIYMGGIVGNVTGGTFTFSMAVGMNLSQTLSATGTETCSIGSFAGYVYKADAAISDDTLSMFNNTNESVASKVGTIGA